MVPMGNWFIVRAHVQRFSNSFKEKEKKKTALEQDRVLKGNQQHEQPVTRLAAKRKAFFMFFFSLWQ